MHHGSQVLFKLRSLVTADVLHGFSFLWVCKRHTCVSASRHVQVSTFVKHSLMHHRCELNTERETDIGQEYQIMPN